jgi:cell division transport system permease protein
MRALRYSVEEAMASLWRGRQSALLSTGTIALALLVLGAFLLVTANLEQLVEQWGNSAEMSVYLKDDVTAAQRAAIEQAIGPGGLVATRDYVSKTDALARFRRTFADLSTAVDGLGGDNPLPASYELRLAGGPGARTAIDNLGTKLRQMPGVADVRYDRQWLDRLLGAVTIVRGVGLLLASVLTLAAALTVANVVRLALYARRDEIDIMQLVGAPHAYIRGPFVMEGVLQGGAGALLALLVLGTGFLAVRARYLAPLASAINLASIRFLPVELCVLLVLGGMLVGCVGGLVAAWNR